MATPVGHMLAGASAAVLLAPGASLGRRVAAGALLGGAADLDFVPGLLLGEPARFHHGASHSLVFAAAVGLLVFWGARFERGRWALAAAAAWASHLLLDFFTHDPTPPLGMTLFWPLSAEHWIAPVTPLPRVLHSSVSVFNWHNAGVALFELVLWGGLLWACLARARRRALDPA